MELDRQDLYWCLRRLPKALMEVMKERPNALAVAGGYIRSCVAGEPVSDVDVFSPSKDIAAACALKLGGEKHRVVETDNAFTVCMRPAPVQFIHRWVYAKPEDVIPSFDFTIARAAFWWNGEKWASHCDDRFYPDLAAKRLVYCSPARNEDAGGSMLRVLKFYQRGYRIPLDSIGRVIARLVKPVNMEQCAGDEGRIAAIITGLLREVDPNVDPEHLAHLPTVEGKPEGLAF